MGATVAVLLTIDTAMACRFLMRRHLGFGCPPAVYSAPAGCYPVASAPVVYGHSSYDGCCGVSGVVVHEGYVEGSYVEGMPLGEQVIPSAPSSPSVMPPAGIGSEVPRTPTPPTPPRDPGVAPAGVEQPTDATPMPPAETDDLPDDDLPSDDLPADDLPADDLPDDDPPADTPADTPADAPADTDDDLFDAPPSTTTPPDTNTTPPPADDVPNDDLDLFDEPSTTTPPAETPDDSVDDLFGAPAGATQPAPSPAETPAPDAEQPLPSDTPDDQEDDTLDDLFGASQNDVEEPRTASAANDPATNDLFDALDSGRSQPAPANDLFQEPAAEPTEQPVGEGPGRPATQPERDNSVDDLDDLFGIRPLPGQSPSKTAESTQPVADQIDELPMREWTDNTGRYQTVGRLVKVTHTHVRLLKDNERYTTVPKYRLSAADLAYVREVTQQLGVETFDQVARK
jgi:hypothetical protein